jgi:hypothetical protein
VSQGTLASKCVVALGSASAGLHLGMHLSGSPALGGPEHTQNNSRESLAGDRRHIFHSTLLAIG